MDMSRQNVTREQSMMTKSLPRGVYTKEQNSLKMTFKMPKSLKHAKQDRALRL